MELPSFEGIKNSLTGSRKGKQCAVKDFSNQFYDSKGKAAGFHFIKFPSTPVWGRSRWCNLIRRQHKKDDFEVTRSTVVCEKHFSPEDINKVPGSTRWNFQEGLFFVIIQSNCLFHRSVVKWYRTCVKCL